MEIAKEVQEELVMELTAHFYKAMIDSISNEHLKYPAYKIENLIKKLRYAILNFCFDDDLLLELFQMMESSTLYLYQSENKREPHKLSA